MTFDTNTSHLKISRRTPWTYSWGGPLLVSLITFLTFSPSLWNEFVNWDDEQFILTTTCFRSFSWTNLHQMFTRYVSGHYQPLVWLSHAIDYAFWGLDPRGYHLTNILLHVANTLLFARLTEKLLMIAAPLRAHETITARRWISYGAALLFGVHPLRVESVAWASERRDVLSGMFVLLTLLAYVPRQQDSSGRGFRFPLPVTVILYIAALASKAIAIPLFGVFILLDLYPLKRLPGNPLHWFQHRYRRIWLEKIWFLIPAVVAAAIITSAQSEADLYTLEQHGLWARLAVCAYGLIFYLYKTILPIHLLPLYELRLPVDVGEWYYPVSAIVAVLITATSLILWRRWPALLISWLCYIFFLSPVLGLFQNGPQLVADRYSYLACLSWVVLIAAGMVYLQTLLHGRRLLAATGVLAIVVGAFSVLSWRQCKVWRTSETLWAHTLRHDPLSTVAGGNLAMYYYHHDRPDDFVRYAKMVLQLKEHDPILNLGMGDVLSRTGRPEEAIYYYNRVIAKYPAQEFAADAHMGLATALVNLGQLPEALPHFLGAIKIKPRLASAWNHLETLRRASPNDPRILAALQDARRIVEQSSGVPATPPQ